MGELWTELSHTLARLDRYAATPDRLDDVRAEVSLNAAPVRTPSRE